MKLKINSILLAFLILSSACTDLSENPYDKIGANEYGQTEKQVGTVVGRAYASLRGGRFDGANGLAFSEYVYFLSAISADEATLPARNGGADWYDGGRYIQLQRHTWDADNVAITGAWRYGFNGISTVNSIINQVENSDLDKKVKESIYAEVRAVRAYFYYRLIDWFGNVPLVIDYKNLDLPTNSTRAQVYEFVEKELKEVIPLLPEKGYGRMTQNAANCLLARLYLNSEVFIQKARWQDCLDVCAKITGDIEKDYFTNFLTQNEVSKEILFSIPYDQKMGTSGNFLNWVITHSQQKWAISATGHFLSGGNSLVAQPGLYSSFDAQDVRRKTMLIGDQIDLRTGTVIDMRPDVDGLQPLSFVESINDIMDAGPNEGAHWRKYEQKSGEEWERNHDLVVMRYAEVLMMQAECNVRLGKAGLARPFIEKIRSRAGLTTPATIDIDFVEQELKKEFIFEDHRRTDMIRFGSFFSGVWWEKTGATPAFRGLFPIPNLEMKKNSKLKQNTGYNQ